VTFKFTTFAIFGLTWIMASCAATQNAAETAETPAPKAETKTEPELEIAAPDPTIELPRPEEGFRMSGILDLPTDREFRSSGSALGQPRSPASPVISRPPTDPPSRIKPNPAASE
jgi:hypothetical protein